MEAQKKALFFSTLTLPGVEQMALDLYFLNQTISKPEIVITLRFYNWAGNWLSIGYHQKKIPSHWEKLINDGYVKIIRRPSGGGAVLHSTGITYALTFKKSSYKNFSYELVNNWLINSFQEIGVTLVNGSLKKSEIRENCFGTSYISDLVDENGFKRIGSAQFRKKGAFLQHGEIQLNPSKDLWFKLFKEEAPPPININLTNNEIIKKLKSSFVRNNSNLEAEDIVINHEDVRSFLKT